MRQTRRKFRARAAEKKRNTNIETLTLDHIKAMVSETEIGLSSYLEKWNARWAKPRVKETLLGDLAACQEIKGMAPILKKLNESFQFSETVITKKNRQAEDGSNASDNASDESLESEKDEAEEESNAEEESGDEKSNEAGYEDEQYYGDEAIKKKPSKGPRSPKIKKKRVLVEEESEQEEEDEEEKASEKEEERGDGDDDQPEGDGDGDGELKEEGDAEKIEEKLEPEVKVEAMEIVEVDDEEAGVRIKRVPRIIFL
jgi:hypothetical protein